MTKTIQKKEISLAGVLFMLALIVIVSFAPMKPVRMAMVGSIAPNPSDSIIQAQSLILPSSSGEGADVGSSSGAGGGGGANIITTATASRVEAKSAGIIGQIYLGEIFS